ncbi:MAG: Bpu10I family restriction endonuclease [Sphaerospermopsis sp. SIO1G2]|nr:Bpu10I family restriction endonuclease [Sphaerospermopsis sp. SIO1G2]
MVCDRYYHQEYVYAESKTKLIDKSKYYADVFQSMIDKIQTLIDDTSPEIEQVLERGHF